MNFGYVSDDALLDRIDFSLPPDDAGNARVLQAGNGAAMVYVGCAEYRVKEWKGLLYPQKTKEADMLSIYASQFRVMEMNGTHYKIYPPEHIARWAAATGPEPFYFLPKFPQVISHESHGYDEMQAYTSAFMESMQAFGDRLGPLFLQMSEWYGPGNRKALFAYLASLPEGFTYMLELRHRDWFVVPELRQELLAALRALGIGLVITDTPGRRELCHMALTLPQVMIRFVARHRHPSTRQRIDSWIERLGAWRAAGLETAYFITHSGFSAPKTAEEVIGKMNSSWGTQLDAPRLLEPSEEPS